MPKFVFTAVDAQGQARKGQVDAESEAHARSAITGKGLQLREIGVAREPVPAPVVYDMPEPMSPVPNHTPVSVSKPPRAAMGAWAMSGQIGRMLLLSGLLLVLLARGCDSIGARGMGRARASLDSAQTRFNREWQKKIADAKDNAEKAKVRTDMEKARKDLEEHTWQGLREDIEDAGTGNQMWGFWREIAFVLGTLVLAAGAVLGAFGGTPAERIFCMIVAAVITFSLYIGGIAWISAVINSAGFK
jgi:hypothetical protein